MSDDVFDPSWSGEPWSTPSTWDDELARALDDVKSAVGNVVASTRVPLFANADVVDLLRREFTPTSWLVSGLITRGGIVVVGAEPKSAKTWLATEIAIAIATGTPACGQFFAERGVAAYFYAEDLGKQVRNRARALLAGRNTNIGAGRLFMRPRGMFLDITRDEDLAWIVASCRHIGTPLDLLVLDPLRDIHCAAEDKSDEMSPVMRRLRLVAELLATTVMVCHHSGKSNGDSSKRRPGQRLRGSGAIHGSIDCGLYLSQLEDEPEDPSDWNAAPSRVDATQTFRIALETEVKGARSSGRHGIELHIDDNEQGEAVRALWRVFEDAPNAASTAIADRVVRVVKESHEGFQNATRLYEATGGKREHVFAAIKQELRIDGGRLERREDGRIHARSIS